MEKKVEKERVREGEGEGERESVCKRERERKVVEERERVILSVNIKLAVSYWKAYRHLHFQRSPVSFPFFLFFSIKNHVVSFTESFNTEAFSCVSFTRKLA